MNDKNASQVGWELVGMSTIDRWSYTDKQGADHLTKADLYM